MSWKVRLDENGIPHVYPLDEESLHNLYCGTSFYCPCNWKLDGNIIIHSSFDGREGLEEALEILKPKSP